MNKIDYYRTVLLGAVIGMSFLTLFYMINTAIDVKEPQPEKPKSNFEVVDRYKNCDLLSWTNHSLADYKYVLYCPS